MANFSEYALMAQEELNKEKQELASRASQLNDKEANLNKRFQDLNERENKLVVSEKDMESRRAVLEIWESKKKREEDVQDMFDMANAKLANSEANLKRASDLDISSAQKLEEITKREIALSEREKTYKEKIAKEITLQALNIRV